MTSSLDKTKQQGETGAIILASGRVVLVDKEDFDELNRHRWFAYKTGNTYYVMRNSKMANGKWKMLLMHREILQLPKEKCVDHIDGNGLNNQRSNLRACSRSENNMNRGKHPNNTSGYKGVSYHKPTKRWQARIMLKGKMIYLGSFSVKETAYQAYIEGAKKYHKEFANY